MRSVVPRMRVFALAWAAVFARLLARPAFPTIMTAEHRMFRVLPVRHGFVELALYVRFGRSHAKAIEYLLDNWAHGHGYTAT